MNKMKKKESKVDLMDDPQPKEMMTNSKAKTMSDDGKECVLLLFFLRLVSSTEGWR